MALAQAGDAAAYRRLLGGIQPWLLRYFARRLPPSFVDDAVQDALVAIHTKRHTFDPARPFGPWLSAVARHKWIDRLRSMGRNQTDALNEEIIGRKSLTLACRAGCSVCCSLRVDVFAHEVFPIAHHIRRHFTAAEIANVMTRLAVHAEKVLAQEGALRNNLLENIPDGVWFKDRESRFTWVNKKKLIDLNKQDAMEIIGKTFVDIIKLFIAPIIFLTIVLGISGMGDLKKVGRIGIKSLFYFEVVSTLALAIGVAVAYFFQPGNIDKSGLNLQDASKYTQNASEDFSWLQFFLSNFTLQVLMVAIVVGISLNFYKHCNQTILVLDRFSKVVFLGLKYVMYLAPLGAFGGMAFTVGKFGLATLIPLGKLMLSVYLTMFLFVFVVLGSILRYYKIKMLDLLKYFREELLLVLGTSSSEAALPSIMVKLENMGCSKSVVGLVIPTGYSFNLDGTSIYLSMAVIFLAQLYNVSLSFFEILSIIGILMITSKGAAGVTGSGFIVLASTLTAIHKIPVEGLAFLLGVDKFMSEARAITNLIGNSVATIVISKSENDFSEPNLENILEEF